ncbi:Melanoma-associated antigen F1 [Trapelia coarctata]|nr:Melanoma-associated antigen F1 [Trapelia coarctata]
MPTINRKRRAQAEASPSPPARRRRSPSASEASSAGSNDDNGDSNPGRTHDQMVKKLVRLALVSEYARQPLRRTDINAKVLAPGSTRTFKLVFESAQMVLRHTFGMTLTALPLREKITVAQKRAAQRMTGNSQGNSHSGTPTAYILTSTLPLSMRTPAILSPQKIPSVGPEASYVGLYTFVVSVIYLSEGGRCSEGRLERALKKVAANDYGPGGEKMDKLLKRMEKEGYIVKIREREAGGEESVEFVVGPRGKVEVGERGVAGCVREVYGDGVTGLEKRLERSLGAGTFKKLEERVVNDGEGEGEEGEGEGEAEEEQGPARRRTSARRSGRRAQEEDEDDQDEEDGDDEGDEEDV